jgi:hypothetical protein
MQTVALALQTFVDRLLSQATTCDDTAIPKNCFDLLFYAKLFLPMDDVTNTSTGSSTWQQWYRPMSTRASALMLTRWDLSVYSIYAKCLVYVIIYTDLYAYIALCMRIQAIVPHPRGRAN